MDRYWRWLRLGLMLSDGVAVTVAYTVARGLRFGLRDIGVGSAHGPVYPVLTVVMAIVTVLLGWQHGTYRRWALFGGHRVYPRILAVATYGVVAVIILSYTVSDSPLVSRTWLLASWLGTVLLLSCNRLLWRQLALRWAGIGRLERRILIAGANQHGVAVAQQLRDQAQMGVTVVGFLDDYKRPGHEILPGIRVLGHPGTVLEQARKSGAGEVIIIAGGLAWESQRLLAEMVTRPDSPLDARISPTFYDLLTTSAELSHVAYVPMLTLRRTRLSGLNAALKGLLDRSVAATALLLLAPGWIYWRVKAWALRVPMLVQDPVLGVEGRAFDVVGLNERLVGSPVAARLPALWNVLWQDLSLIGPRPIRAGELRDHERWLANLFAMRPGLSGLWRLRGEELPVDERVALDLYYIRNYSLTLDAVILYNTFRQLVRRLLGKPYSLARWIRHEDETVARRGLAPALPSTFQERGGASKSVGAVQEAGVARGD